MSKRCLLKMSWLTCIAQARGSQQLKKISAVIKMFSISFLTPLWKQDWNFGEVQLQSFKHQQTEQNLN